MASTTKTTTIKYPVDEFIKLLNGLNRKLFGVNHTDINVKFIIREVGGDYLDRYPGQPQVVAVEISYEEKS